LLTFTHWIGDCLFYEFFGCGPHQLCREWSDQIRSEKRRECERLEWVAVRT